MTNVEEILLGARDVAFVRNSGAVVWPEYAGHGNIATWYDFMGRTDSDINRGVAEDLYVGGNDVVLQNFAYESGSGYDNGLVFDGVDDYGVQQNQDEGIWGLDQLTIEGVFSKNINRPQTIVGCGQLGYGNFNLGVSGSNMAIWFSNGFAASNLIFTFSGTAGISVDFFFSVALDKSSSSGWAVINGVEYAFDLGQNRSGAQPFPIYLGSRSPTSHLLAGNIKSLRIYNKQLTIQEMHENNKIDKIRWNLQ